VREESAEKEPKTTMTNAETDKTVTLAEQGAHVAPEKAPSKKGATRKKGAPKSKKTAKGGKAKPGKKNAKSAQATEATLPRPESKGAKILALVQRPKGATLAELAKLTGWQNHSIRGFLSAAVGKKMGLTVVSVKREDGERVYSIKK
jgi:hypothetical protein